MYKEKRCVYAYHSNFALAIKNEPPHDKANKMACAPSEDSDQTARQSDQSSLSAWRSTGPLATQ